MSRDLILSAYDSTRALTAKTLELMPEEKAEYRPVPEVFSFRQLARHILSAELSLMDGWASGHFEWETRYNDETLPTLASIQAVLPAATAAFREWIAARTDAELAAPVPEMGGASLERLLHAWLRHEAHHRGQMFTYLRLNGIAPPVM